LDNNFWSIKLKIQIIFEINKWGLYFATISRMTRVIRDMVLLYHFLMVQNHIQGGSKFLIWPWVTKILATPLVSFCCVILAWSLSTKEDFPKSKKFLIGKVASNCNRFIHFSNLFVCTLILLTDCLLFCLFVWLPLCPLFCQFFAHLWIWLSVYLLY